MPASVASLRVTVASVVAQQTGVSLTQALGVVREVFLQHSERPMPATATEIEDEVLTWVTEAVEIINSKDYPEGPRP